ncbi:TRAP transporter substrate-binding protein [Pseudosulfitobacter pseudonitzschiae]|uniref:TRAP transporter substrate-binding protein n=1 Tax=Pseudosulfitobacter pseudonitzschiae TaxID=1402135 RepID=UPI001AF8EAD5|nr:TRAP transporter substrate-binding protein [Pseudosulfitobacter pseudonitzschiae]MBM1816275.1 TRAP transporter substrate-binding protein [Pseudosulfitobacter pseudonitzschiae]MBM1833788.1 TRAP transporter substrate-binding protein [Pseudosulfitobacter pseudonitzschiae]MBM1838654.1 TRAP transporter substrate-binding protein [Pseudosulfitobacter pseudonitzschiae]MBM1843002.1 TRAP transporter substrate-binding protein [Pseudosulfitobacter pseudonitzschiae]MBM1847868.1 TRAP transporter substrat
MNKRTLLIGAAAAVAMLPGLAFAQEVTLRLHQFLPPVATVPAKILKPWGEELTAASDGRIVIQHFDAMALGGRPPELLDQARDGVVDLAMTVVGYTPGRYPRTEVFELPFMMKDPVGTSRAFWEMVETDFQESEYQDVKVLGAWVHGPGVIHTKDPVTKLEDMKGKTLRGPTRVINDMLSELGATPVGMPLPAIPEALSKGVVNGTVIPWEVTPSIRLAELVSNHAEFSGDEALYTATIVLVMNRAKYDALPDDLKAILDEKSGAALSTFAAEVMFEYDKPGRDIAVEKGNTIVQLDEAEVARWKEAAQPVVARWVADMDSKGIDGQALIDQAKGLIDKYSN